MTLLIRRKWKVGTNLLFVHRVKFTQRRVWFNGEHWLVKILTLLKIKLHLLSKRGKVVLVHDLKLNSDLFHIELSFIYNFAFELWASGNLHWFTCLLDQESYLINYLESESSVHDRNIFWFCTKNWFKWSKFLPEHHGVQSTVTREFLRNLSQTTSHQHLVISSKYRPLIGQGK